MAEYIDNTKERLKQFLIVSKLFWGDRDEMRREFSLKLPAGEKSILVRYRKEERDSPSFTLTVTPDYKITISNKSHESVANSLHFAGAADLETVGISGFVQNRKNEGLRIVFYKQSKKFHEIFEGRPDEEADCEAIVKEKIEEYLQREILIK